MADIHDDGVMADRINLRGLVIGALVIAAAIAIAVIGAYFFLYTGAAPPRLAAGDRPPPRIEGDVRLQRQPARDIAAFAAEKRRLIESYGWVDRERGIARIPIERAMAILAAKSGASKTP